MHSLELTNIDKSRVYRPAMNAWSNDKQRFRPPDIRPIVPIESGRASLSQPLQSASVALYQALLEIKHRFSFVIWFTSMSNPHNNGLWSERLSMSDGL